MHGLSVWNANSSELNLFFSSLFWLDVGVNAVQSRFLYGDDSSKASPLLTNKRLLALLRTSSQQQQSQTLITPLYYCCKSTRTIRRGTITQADAIIHITPENKESDTCVKKELSPSSCLCSSSSFLFNVYIFIILFLTCRSQCQPQSWNKFREADIF